MPNLQNEVIMTEVIEEVEKIKEHNGEVEQVDSKAQRLDFRVQRVDSKGQREDSYKKLKIRNVGESFMLIGILLLYFDMCWNNRENAKIFI